MSVDYRLAPEHPCPAAIGDALAVYRAVEARWPARPVVAVGDSAGANLALSLALRCRDRSRGEIHDPGLAAPAGLVLLSPHVDHGVDDRLRPDGRPSDLDPAGRAWLAAAYRGGLSPEDPRLSPLRAPLDGLPPMLIQVGTADTSFEQATRLARRARAAGVAVELDVWSGLRHTWHYHRDLPEADRALAEVGAWICARSTDRTRPD